MSVNFKKVAQSATVLSELMEGREQIKMDDIVRMYPSGVTVDKFDIVTIPDKDNYNENKMYPCCTFLEDTTKYFNGGFVLKKIFDAIVVEFDGDISTASSELEKSGGLHMVFTNTKTKSGNNLTAVQVI